MTGNEMTGDEMTCAGVVPALGDYLDGFLDPASEAAVRAHTDACEACGAALRGQVDAALAGPAFEAERRLIGAAVAATRASPGREAKKIRRIVFAASGLIAAAVAVVAFVQFRSTPSPEERILAELRRGPLDVKMASYRLVDRAAKPDGLDATGELVVDGPRLTLQTNRPDGGLIQATGFDGTWRWSFDPREDRLKVSRGDGGSGGTVGEDPVADVADASATDEPALVDAGLAPGLLTGRALADYLLTHYDLDFAGEQDVDGHACWILTGVHRADGDAPDADDDGEAADADPTWLRCYVDTERRVMRKWVQETPLGTRTAILTRLGSDENVRFGPAAFVSPQTRLDLQSSSFPLEGIPLNALVDEIQSSFGVLKMGIAVGIDTGALDGPFTSGAPQDGDRILTADLPHEVQSLLSLLGHADDGGGIAGIFAGGGRTVVIRGVRGARSFPELPTGFSAMVSPERLRDAIDLKAILDVLSEVTGVEIVVRGQGSLLAAFQFHAPVPVPARMVLLTAAEAHGLTVQVDGAVVVLTPSE